MRGYGDLRVPHDNELAKFDFLRELALELGAADAKIIPASKVVVEDRVVLKCRFGCKDYGKTLACPPYTPTPSEFRKIVSEYNYAMFMKFKSKAEADVELQQNLSKPENDPMLSEDVRERVKKFWATWKEDKRWMLETVVRLEKAAMSRGYPLAVGFISGSCQLCEKCDLETRICRHPEMARPSEDALGVNVRKTAQNAGIEVTFPFAKNPESFALLLID